MRRTEPKDELNIFRDSFIFGVDSLETFFVLKDHLANLKE